MHLSLGSAYAGLGKREEAVAAGQQGAALMSLERDALMSGDALYALTVIYADLGEDDLALDTMARLLSVPSMYGGFWFTKHPAFKALREEPRFWKILEG